MPTDTAPGSQLDAERCYRIACSRDGRFDGMFVTAVTTTRVYCRPSCPAVTPRQRNVRFYLTPAAAQEAGFRACKRCRPDAAPGSPEWDSRADVVARSVRLIGDGLVEREGVGGLARRVGYSPRHLTRLMAAELGTGPLRLAMAHRVQTARALLETSELTVTDVAWAAGFKSIRQFNDLIRRVYDLTPGELRSRAAGPRRSAARSGEDPGAGRGGPGATARRRPRAVAGSPEQIRARLMYRPPLDAPALLAFLGARAVPGVEAYDGHSYTTSLRLPHGFATATVWPPGQPAGRPGGRAPHLDCDLYLDDVRDYGTAVARLRRLLDLDADPVAVADGLARDPVLAPLIEISPGRRMPGTADVGELAVRAVVGQQVSLASARTALGKLAERFGAPIASPRNGVERAFPAAAELAGADPAKLPLPRSRAAALQHLAADLAGGALELHPGTDRDRAEAELLALPGIGPWTAAYIRMRGLGDPDVLPPGDAAIRRALAGRRPAHDGTRDHAHHPAPGAADGWKPWRTYATAHLWAAAGRPPVREEPRP